MLCSSDAGEVGDLRAGAEEAEVEDRREPAEQWLVLLVLDEFLLDGLERGIRLLGVGDERPRGKPGALIARLIASRSRNACWSPSL